MKKKPAETQRKTPVGKLVAAALAVLLVIVGSVWAVREGIESRREAANLAEVQQMREQFKPEVMKEKTPEERGEFFKEYREKTKKLTFAQRKKLSDERYAREKPRYEEYFSAPEDQRDAVLAKQMEEMRKRWGGRGNRGNQGGNANGNGNGGPGAGNNQRGQGQGNGGQSPDDDEAAKKSREAARRERLDMTTPDQRAQRSVYRQAMRQMRQQQQNGGR